jgi:hypothetical protein
MEQETEKLSPWWRRGVFLVLAVGFAVLIWMAVRAYRDAPPIPETVVTPAGEVVFTGDQIRSGQQVFLKYGLVLILALTFQPNISIPLPLIPASFLPVRLATSGCRNSPLLSELRFRRMSGNS